jgi:beta-lactam-binding protein with PASTA domain
LFILFAGSVFRPGPPALLYREPKNPFNHWLALREGATSGLRSQRYQILLQVLSPVLKTVPNVIGLTESTATGLIGAAGFITQTIYNPNPNVGPDVILSQTPLGGTQALTGSTVNLVASSFIITPNEIGVSQSQAQNDLGRLGFVPSFVPPNAQYSQVVASQSIPPNTYVNPAQYPSGVPITLIMQPVVTGLVTVPQAIYTIVNDSLIVGQPIQWVYNANVPYNYVISQSPPAGSVLPLYTPVYLTASLGPPPITQTLITPNVVGSMILDARQAMVSAGLNVTNPIWQYSSTVQGDYVIAQSVAPGTIITQGTSVTLTVSAGTAVTPLPGATVVIPVLH